MALNYQIKGDGPPLLLLHGMGVTFPIWENLVPLLRDHYKLILVELPGHGRSPALPKGVPYYQGSAAMLEELRCELGIEQWSILGYSMGARALQAYLDCYPDRVRSAIFLCPASLNRLWAASLKTLIATEQKIPGVADWLLHGWRLPRLVRLLGFNGRSHPYAAVWTREISSQPTEVIKALLLDLPGAGRAPLPVPQRPALFIWGARDTIVAKPRRLRPFDRLVPGTHSAPMLLANEIAEYVKNFDCPAQTDQASAGQPGKTILEGEA